MFVNTVIRKTLVHPIFISNSVISQADALDFTLLMRVQTRVNPFSSRS